MLVTKNANLFSKDKSTLDKNLQMQQSTIEKRVFLKQQTQKLG